MHTRVKICGITRWQDARDAIELGADALGFVFFRGSSRLIDAREAAAIASRLPPFVSVVALFLSPTGDEVREVIEVLRPHVLQFHGEESPDFCSGFHLPFIKAVPMARGVDLAAWTREFAKASAVLLDSHVAGEAGGSGRPFDWSMIDRRVNHPMILAGGLSADNVEAAVERVRPYAVDVSSGVESAPGIKDAGRMREFFRGVRRADSKQ